jgi:FAD/FMN-containing dehydrogenase
MQDQILRGLEEIVGADRVSANPHTLECYACDATVNPPARPDYAVLAATVEQIQAIIRLASTERIPVVPAVGMSSTGGLTIPVKGGIVLDLHLMNRIVEINEDVGYAVVEPGVTIGQIDAELKQRGYWVQVPAGPPGSAGLLPGYILHGYGHLGAKFGINSEQITGMEVVLPSGEVARLGACAVSPYWFHRTPLPDLMGLFLGWQGATGIVTKLGVNIYPRPSFKAMVGWGLFSDHDEPLPERCARFLIKLQRADVAHDISGHSWGAVQIGRGRKWPLPPKPVHDPEIFFSATAYAFTEEELAVKKRTLEALIQEAKDGGLPIASTDVTDRAKTEMPTRYSLRYSDHRGGGGLDYIGSITPVIKWPSGVKRLTEIFERYGFTPYIRLSIYRGTAQGMLRALVPYHRSDDADVEAVRKMNREFVEVLLDCGGLIYKAPDFACDAMWRRADPAFVALLKRAKGLLDPCGIMNPGRLGL